MNQRQTSTAEQSRRVGSNGQNSNFTKATSTEEYKTSEGPGRTTSRSLRPSESIKEQKKWKFVNTTKQDSNEDVTHNVPPSSKAT